MTPVLRALRRPRSLRAPLAVAVLAVLAGLLAAPASADEVPEGYEFSHAWFDSTDGTQLHAGVFLPADSAPGEEHPVLLVSTPYTAPNGGALGGNTRGPVIRFPELFEHEAFRAGRYAYVQVDVRGFGGSEGCFGYYLPPEAEDVRVAVEWAASQDWSTGRVGMWGKSYDAAQQVLALASDPEGLAASVIQAPGLSAYTALWMNGVHYATGRYATTSVYNADDLAPPQNADTIGSPEYAAAAAAPVTSLPGDPTCRTDALVGMNVIGDRDDPFWEGKEPYLQAAGSDVPVFWQHGFWDANTKPVHLDIWSSLTGPKQAWFGQTTHLRGHEAGVGREGFNDEAFRFLDEHVRGIRPAGRPDPAVTVQSGGPDGQWRAEKAWPPADASSWTLPVRAGSYVDSPDAVVGGPARAGHWTMTPELPHAAHVAGEVVVSTAVSSPVPGAHLVARLYDVGPDGVARLMTRGAHALEAGASEVSFALYPQDWVLEPGHRLGLHLSAGDDNWFSPGVTGARVTVAGGALDVPVLRFARTEFLEGGVSNASSSPTVTVPPATVESATVPSDAPPAQQESKPGERVGQQR